MGMGGNRIVFIAIGAVIGIGIAFFALYDSQTQEMQQVPAAAVTDDKYLPSGTNSWMYPGEPLPEDEMRVTIMGTGWGFVRPGQADQSFFVELGNGDNFMFDLGEGSEANYMKMMVPYSKMNNLFIGHLHMDHLGSLPHVYAFGPTGDRFTPMNIWGPSGDTPELGTKYMVEGLTNFTNWHVTSFKTSIPESDGYKLNVHEFDYKLNPGIAYEKNGVVIKHFPAAHTIDGGVNFRVEWNGLCVIIPSDTNPTTFDIDNGKDCDLVMHEVGPDPNVYSKKMGISLEMAQGIVDSSHTNPVALGKILSITQPRLAVVTHTVLNSDTTGPIIDGVRKYYDGPLVIGSDMMVFNINHDEITQRMAIGPDSPWLWTEVPSPDNPPELDNSKYKSKYLLDNRIPKCENATAGQICY
jgi:ribonuclease Z